MKNILLVEDGESMAVLYMAYLRKAGYAARHAATMAAALRMMKETPFDAMVCDIMLPDGSGIDVLKSIHACCPDVPVIMITASTSVEGAVEAMRLGAYDFITKPFPAERLTITLSLALERHQLKTELQERMAEADEGFGPFIGRSAAMQAVYRTLRHVAGSRAPVFVTGESGVGKELAARALHQHGPRRHGPFVAVNCGAIPANLMESELFGHVKGAFTGAVADNKGALLNADKGILFLDEVCDMPLDAQVKLLRAVQMGVVTPVGSSREIPVDVRFVAATNRSPLDEVKAGRFREDLYYRLFVVPVELPPLRDRGDDIQQLADAFLKRYAAEEHKTFMGFDDDVRALLALYPWPGNVRQLENVVRYVVAMRPGGTVTRADLPPLDEALAVALPGLLTTMLSPLPPLPQPLWQMEQEAIDAALQHTEGDVVRAAALLEINPSTVYRKLQARGKSATSGA